MLLPPPFTPFADTCRHAAICLLFDADFIDDIAFAAMLMILFCCPDRFHAALCCGVIARHAIAQDAADER